ncbi:CHAT domain-containing protein [Ephemerocybe angulata]|uniref:CHAT domain-containing protein n=1 Tax=Ephemerocybe angulata TaxID=980116 RepID=A0A8H6M2C8_9AGAR|nr:CHAT domain-containing protein [Tulosesus angulatus]
MALADQGLENTLSMAKRLNADGFALYHHFQRTGDLRDITESTEVLRKSLELTPEGHADMPIRLDDLGHALYLRFHHTGDVNNLTEGISTQRKAVEVTPDGDIEMPVRFSNLGASLESLFERTGALQHLNEAILNQRNAVELTPKDHRDAPTFLSNLGEFLQSLFKRTGDLQDLTEAISIHRKAVELTPDDDPDMSIWLNGLGSSMESLYERTGDLHDLIEATSIRRRALELTPDGHPALPTRLNNLAISLEYLHYGTGDIKHLTEAVSMQRRAVDLTPDGHAKMPIWLNSLGSFLESHFHLTGDLNDLTEAISIHRRAVKPTPHGHAQLPTRISNLGTSLQSLFELSGDLQNLTEAILMHRRAVELTPDGHAAMPSYLNSLGFSLELLFKRTGEHHTRSEAISNYKASATYPSGPPYTRLQAARNWVQILNLSSSPPPADILAAFDTTIYLITLTATLEQTLERRYTQLQDSSGLPLQAASAALALGRVDKALEWLEQGRCLVWGQLTNLRRPLDDLRHHSSDLAGRFVEVSKRLEAAGTSTGTKSRDDISPSEKTSLAEKARENLNLLREWDDLLVEVRAIPGFETFLKPLPCNTLLKNLPESGYVVVINIDECRCDAIVLVAGQDQPIHIPLPDFSLERCEEYRKDLGAQLQSYSLRDRGREIVLESEEGDGKRGIRSVHLRGKRGETVIQGILRGLWKAVVKPILQRLGVLKIDRSRTVQVPPRIWWCPAGPLSFLPLHAAGIYTATGSESVLDYAVSSYTPTVAALIDRVKKGHSIDKTMSGLFMTSQPNASGASSIPGTTKEIHSIYELAKKGGIRVEKLEGSETTAANCLDTMMSFSSVHLACHASQNNQNPLGSRFLFHNGSLDLSSILQRNLKNADLAFLSACQTSTGAQKLPDEAVHLAAGMLAAGYRRVVATMWSIGDRHAPDVAVDFYQYLLDQRDTAGKVGFDGQKSAHALQHSVEQLRLRLIDNTDQSLLAWIPYVHFGY